VGILGRESNTASQKGAHCEQMSKLRAYRATIATTWYDKTVGAAREFEVHFQVSRPGKIRTVRRMLAKRGVPYFQYLVHRRVGRWVPKSNIKVRFEREMPASKSGKTIQTESRSMLYRGKRWRAYSLGRGKLLYAGRVKKHGRKKRSRKERKKTTKRRK